jgi:tetratricopeptide (TPR) repeat protein
MRTPPSWMNALMFAAFTSLFISPSLSAEPSRCDSWVARVESIQGQVQTRVGDTDPWRGVTLHETLCPGDRIRVGAESRAALVLRNETLLRLDQLTTLTLSGLAQPQDSWLDIFSGIVEIISRVPGALKIKTPFVNAAIEGTEFVVSVTQTEGSVTVLEGRVLAENSYGSLVLGPGQSAAAGVGQPPQARIGVRPRDAVQWALYYPPLLDRRVLTVRDSSPWHEAMVASLTAYENSDIGAAFSAISAVVEPSDGRFFAHRAALRLIVGRVDEAAADIERAQRLAPGNAHALALRSLIALSQNEKERSIALAREAVDADAQSVPAWIALSYAQQGLFDIQGAAGSVSRALNLDQDDSLVWARLAELQLSLGDTLHAREAAQRALELSPRSSRARTMLGFVYLSSMDVARARNEFEQAITSDSADAMPRLGLGLAIIRTGDLAAGRREIEIAAILDPNNALIRSYLGKAYYEEKRGRLAESQFALAKTLDPADPTPFFYDAIRKQTENRPVEALRDLQKSIELNDNRAVYRSRLLLDQDLAARSASLARVYADLGFQQLALVEGWKSVIADPTNYSAHRFLADSYSALPGHEVARVSELMQAQLLQPLNINPIQPQITEANLFILDGAGPTDGSLNEYTSLFHRDRFVLQATGIAGSEDTRGYEVVQSGLQDRVSYSLGRLDYRTEGFRTNNDIDQWINTAFVQGQLSPSTSLQAEARDLKRENGDVVLRFDPNNFSALRRELRETNFRRLGLHHALIPGSDLVISASSQDSTFIQNETFPAFGSTTKFSEQLESRGIEVQHLFRGGGFHTIAGGGHYDAKGTQLTVVEFAFPCPFPTCEFPQPVEIRHNNAYLYSYFHVRSDAHVVLGASADRFRDRQITRDHVNPKLGLTWDIDEGTTLRVAAFRTLKRSLVSNQTVEPTVVAGFNQFFDDPAGGTDSYRSGLAINHRFAATLQGGLESTSRHLWVPFTDLLTSQPEEARWSEHIARAYLYWTPDTRFAIGTEYEYEKLDRGTDFQLNEIVNSRTNRLPLSVRYFGAGGITARLRTTHVDQQGVFSNLTTATSAPGHDQFWVTDAEVEYRLPGRRGFVTVGAKNLFGEKFHYQDTDPGRPRFVPERITFVRVSMVF